jgi:glycosyltransferase involved in cell wall biosynthesis
VFLRRGFDVIHAHNPPDTFVLIAGWYKLFGKRFVFDHHDLSPEMYEALFGDGSRPVVRRLLLLLEKLTFRAADLVIATNESYREIAIGRGRVNPQRVAVVRNGPDPSRVRPGRIDPELRARAATILAYVGVMGHQDGVDYLIRALHLLKVNLGRSEFLCVIVGTGVAVPGLKELASELGLDEHVWFTGRVPDEDLMRYLSTADICVDPDPSNPFNDRSTMIKMTEYMAMGKPIVAFDLPEHRFTAQGSALYAQANDELDMARKLAFLMDHPDERAKLGAMGRQRFEDALAWSHQEGKLVAAYDGLMRPGGIAEGAPGSDPS